MSGQYSSTVLELEATVTNLKQIPVRNLKAVLLQSFKTLELPAG